MEDEETASATTRSKYYDEIVLSSSLCRAVFVRWNVVVNADLGIDVRC